MGHAAMLSMVWTAGGGPRSGQAIQALAEWLGSAGYWLIGLHAAAGLFHHYWVRDNTLVRMLPKR